LREGLVKGELGDLNPFPFAMMTGNCLGWTAYGYYTRDPFVVAANVPGLVLSLWLNTGAAKLQYLGLRRRGGSRHLQRSGQWAGPPQELWDASPEHGEEGAAAAGDGDALSPEMLVMVPQERALLRILCLWVIVLVYAGWFSPSADPSKIIGVAVNINLVFFYGVRAPFLASTCLLRRNALIPYPCGSAPLLFFIRLRCKPCAPSSLKGAPPLFTCPPWS
jgi:solute carrier family 50 protein (sugar transporter)